MNRVGNDFLYEVTKNMEYVTLYPIEPQSLVFEKRVRLNCFYCKNYGVNWKCPSKIPELDYQAIVNEYENGLFVKVELPVSEETFSDIRIRSTNELHQTLLKLERALWEHNFPMAVSFIGGSCKLCKNGCGKERCNNPGAARIPMEAIGINVVESAKKYGISIVFPPQNTLVRIGTLLW